MLYSPKLYVRDLWIAVPGALSLLAQAVILFWIMRNVHPTAEQIFLHYNIIFGVDLIGEWWKIYYLSIFAVLAFMLNYALSFWFYVKDRFLSRMLSLFTLMVELFLLLGAWFIIGLNL